MVCGKDGYTTDCFFRPKLRCEHEGFSLMNFSVDISVIGSPKIPECCTSVTYIVILVSPRTHSGRGDRFAPRGVANLAMVYTMASETPSTNDNSVQPTSIRPGTNDA